MIELPKSIIKYLIWWAYRAPKKLFTISKRLTLLVNYEFSFTINLRLIFTPLYGDYTIIGRIIGFVARIIFIVSGFIFISTLSVVTILLPLAWFTIPILGIYFLGIWFVPVIAGTYLYVTYKNLDLPDAKVSEIKKDKAVLKTFRPETKRYYSSVKNGSVYNLLKFLKTGEVKNVLIRTELANTNFVEETSKVKNIDYEKVKIKAYELAKHNGSRFVEMEHLFAAILQSIPNVDTYLSTYGINFDTIKRGVFWIIDQREYYASLYFWQDAYKMPPITGFGHGLTGRITPDLDSISRDFTEMAKKGRIKNVVGRDDVINKITQLLGGSSKNVLLIGEPGCGKTTLIRGMAYRIMFGTEYKTLQNKRVVSLEMGGLIAGTSTSGQIAHKLKRAMNDVVESGDIILFIDEIHSL